MKSKILIIEDESRMRRILQLLLEGAGYAVGTASDGLQGMAEWQRWSPDAVICDIKMPGADGLQVLDFKIRKALGAPLILLTAFGTIDMAVSAIKRGAFDYITKPFDNTHVLQVIAQAVAENTAQPHDPEMPPETEMIGSSPAMAEIRAQITTVAATPTSVLITGESGTGKELVARAIHLQSRRRNERLVWVNCAAIPRELLESELFGHRKGAFTGAVGDRSGAFVNAHGGSLFLDEIGDLPLDLQPKLLHAVEVKTVTPVGGDRGQAVDVKIISATNRNLRQMAAAGQFRNDLFYRLNAFQIHVPPLRERREDICRLAEHFMRLFAGAYQRDITCLDDQARQCLTSHHWPGNIRELRNVVERAVLSSPGPVITLRELPDDLGAAAHQKGNNGAATAFDLLASERQLIGEALRKSAGNQAQAARLLRISRNTLRYRMKKHGIATE